MTAEHVNISTASRTLKEGQLDGLRENCKQAPPWGPVVRTQRFHCWRPGFHPWLGNKDPASRVARPKTKQTNKKTANARGSFSPWRARGGDF